MLCNRSDDGDFARVQECICGPAERGPNIEGDDKFSRGARVTCTCCIHDGSQSKAMDRVRIRSIAGDLKLEVFP